MRSSCSTSHLPRESTHFVSLRSTYRQLPGKTCSSLQASAIPLRKCLHLGHRHQRAVDCLDSGPKPVCSSGLPCRYGSERKRVLVASWSSAHSSRSLLTQQYCSYTDRKNRNGTLNKGILHQWTPEIRGYGIKFERRPVRTWSSLRRLIVKRPPFDRLDYCISVNSGGTHLKRRICGSGS